MILPHDPPLSAVLSLCTDQTLINGPPCQTQILSRAGLCAMSPTYWRCARALTQSALHTMRRDTKHTRRGAITHNCVCINICWSITFLFNIHFQPDTKSIDLWDISLSLPAFQSLIYRAQYYIMPKEWRLFPRDAWARNANPSIQASKGYTPLLSEIGLCGRKEEVIGN